MAVKMGINGFGRIGRLVMRAGFENQGITIVAINEPFMDLDYMEYLLKYDSVHKGFNGTVTTRGKGTPTEFLVVNGLPVRVFHEKDPGSIGWGAVGAMYICESTGVFTEQKKAEMHIKGGAKKSDHFCAAKGQRANFCDGCESPRLQERVHRRFQCVMHHELLGPNFKGYPRQLWHRGGSYDHGACNDGNSADGRWT
jgi:glyceraldehyde-3-phosphate dehydrogenase/erythrose-4-phosphate dehydrogenase